jgi:hypothetical protein
MAYGYGYSYGVSRRALAAGRAPGPTSFSLSASSFDEDAEAGSMIATISAESDTEGATYTFTLLDDAGGMFVIDGANLNLATAVPAEETLYLRDVTIQGTIDQTGGSSSEVFTLTIEPVDTSNDSGLEDTEGTLVAVGDFTLAPTVGGGNGALKFKGKNGGLSYFVFDIGAAQPGGIYTYSYVPHFQELSNGGKEAFVGFGFKTGNSFHLTGLKGDGATGLTKHKIAGTGIGPNDYTSSGSGAPANGTQAGPNFVQIEISGDGSTYTIRTSGDSGATWADEFTASVPTPFSDTATTQFGLAVFLENSDKGRFSLDVTEWSAAVPEVFFEDFTSPFAVSDWDVLRENSAHAWRVVDGQTLQDYSTGTANGYRFLASREAGIIADVDVVGTVRKSTNIRADENFIVARGGVSGNITGYAVQLHATGTTSGPTVRLVRFDGDGASGASVTTLATLATGGGGSWAINTFYRFRLRCIGNSIKGKYWAASASEPSAWSFEVTDATYASGRVGVGVWRGLNELRDFGMLSIATNGAVAPLTDPNA